MGRRPVSSSLITIRLRAVPFNITVVQAYAPTSDYDDNEIEEFYDQLKNVIDQTPCENWHGICGPFCNDDTNKRELRFLEFATFSDLVLANTFGHRKATRRWAWHS